MAVIYSTYRDRSAEWRQWERHYRMKYPGMSSRKLQEVVARQMRRR